MAAYRATAHPAMGFNPNFLMFGREFTLPVDSCMECPRGRRKWMQDPIRGRCWRNSESRSRQLTTGWDEWRTGKKSTLILRSRR